MSRSRAKGTAAESQVVAYLQSMGFPKAERRALHGVNDRGDVTSIPSTVIQVKNWDQAKLGQWVKQMIRQRDNDGAAWGVVWHKKKGTQFPGQWYVTTTGEDFVKLLRSALGIED